MGYHTLQSTHYIVEAMRFAFYDRNSKLGDPDFVNNPVAELTAKNYAAKIRAKISPTKLSSIIPAKIMHAEGMHTTHYSVLDKNGNAVAVTYTLNNLFGAALIAGDTGFLLNDTMDDFTSKPGSPNFFGLVQGVENRIDPGKRPLSAMTPTVVLYKGKPILILGSPGGPRIITATMLTLINIFDFGLNVQQAVDAPRFHQQWLPEAVDVEPNVFAPATTLALSNMGYTFTPVEKWGAVEAIYIDPLTHKIYGGSDRRRQAGRAIGY
jgi:gamma-glutamyltranspeptidase/glutathione hydrolase